MVRSTSTEDLGEPLQFDPDFNGPLRNRSCTDILCLLLFFVFVGCWAGIGIYAIKNGDPNTLLVPKDSTGSRCGIDSHVKDQPYLFFHDLTKCLEPSVPFTGCQTTQVCVKSCPTENYYTNGPWALDEQYCSQYVATDCPDWYLKSTSFLNRCLYNVADRRNLKKLDVSRVTGDEISAIKKLLNPIHMWMSIAVQNGLAYCTQNEHAHQIGQNIVEDIMNSWWKILIGVFLALLASIIYIVLLRWIASPMVWLSIVGVVVALGAGLYFTTKKYIEIKNEYDNAVYEAKTQLTTKRNLWLAGVIIISVVLCIILLMLIFLRKRIMLAIALVKEGSKAVSSVTASLFFPILPWILQVGVIAYAIVVALFLTGSGEPIYETRNITTACTSLTLIENETPCVPDDFINTLNTTAVIASSACSNAKCKFIQMQNDAFYPYLQAFNIFGFFWLAFFVSALGQMVLASVFSQWYWTFNKRTLPFFAVTSAFCRTLRYHIGTLAFGSLIIAICRMIRVCLEYLDQKLKRYDNELTRAIMCCLKCFFWCLEKFLKFINKNAYIMCAVHGKNFCASAKDAFLLLMRNIIRVFVLDKVTDFLFFLSKLLVTLGVGAVSYVIFVTDLTPIDNSGLNYGMVPVVIIMICTYLISSLFFSVYSMAVDTLFLCFLEDCERNNGSSEKPYYMSRNLMKIFGKKNKSS